MSYAFYTHKKKNGKGPSNGKGMGRGSNLAGGGGGGGGKAGGGKKMMMPMMMPNGQMMMVNAGGTMGTMAQGGNCAPQMGGKSSFCGGIDPHCQGQPLHSVQDCMAHGASAACCMMAAQGDGTIKGYEINNCCNCNMNECGGGAKKGGG